MYYVYALINNDERLYIGQTNNLRRRFIEHQKGYHRSTKAYRPYKLIHQEEFNLRIEARNREKYLKSGIGRSWLKNKYRGVEK